ncbi:hypothetical protein B9Z55_021434 [Caenorhabditis nigoni]|nr:hypothetical protein B9Z55_021434 [Caenorhabditis nigoni]
MPELVMEKIFSDLDFFDLISLRKVCQSLRFFIDNFRKLDPGLQEIRITVEPKSIKSTYRFLDNSERMITYQRLPNISSLLKWDQKKRILENSNYIDIFLKDFEIFWKNQKLKLEKFQLDLTGNPLRIIYGIQKILAGNSNFEMGKFEIETSNPCQISKILSKLYPKILEIWNKNDEKEYWDLDEISKLNQWKNAKKVTINGFYVDPEIQILENFEKIDLIFEAISWEQILEVKKTLLSSRTMECFRIEFEYFKFEKMLIKTFGVPYFPPGRADKYGQKWFFRLAIPEKILEIRYHSGNRSICFQKIDSFNLPDGAVLQ